MEHRKIVYRKLEELTEYTGNPRKISDEAIEQVAKSIEEFGITNPILIDSNDVIVAGHTRAKACRTLGIKDVPTICLNDLSEEQVKAYRLVDNRSAEFTEWDFPSLEEELDDILNDGVIDMDDFGFAELGGLDLEVMSDDEEKDSKPPLKKDKAVTCPHCGEEFFV